MVIIVLVVSVEQVPLLVPVRLSVPSPELVPVQVALVVLVAPAVAVVVMKK